MICFCFSFSVFHINSLFKNIYITNKDIRNSANNHDQERPYDHQESQKISTFPLHQESLAQSNLAYIAQYQSYQ